MVLLKQIWVVFGVTLLSFAAMAANSVQVHEAWIPQAPPVAMMHAGYLQITNHSDQPVVLIAVESDDYESVEMHRTVTKDGMSRMIKQDEVIIAPGKRIDFERGGLHLMLMHPKRPLAVGDSSQIKLIRKDKQVITFTATVKAATLDDHDHSHHH